MGARHRCAVLRDWLVLPVLLTHADGALSCRARASSKTGLPRSTTIIRSTSSASALSTIQYFTAASACTRSRRSADSRMHADGCPRYRFGGVSALCFNTPILGLLWKWLRNNIGMVCVSPASTACMGTIASLCSVQRVPLWSGGAGTRPSVERTSMAWGWCLSSSCSATRPCYLSSRTPSFAAGVWWQAGTCCLPHTLTATAPCLSKKPSSCCSSLNC